MRKVSRWENANACEDVANVYCKDGRRFRQSTTTEAKRFIAKSLSLKTCNSTRNPRHSFDQQQSNISLIKCTKFQGNSPFAIWYRGLELPTSRASSFAERLVENISQPKRLLIAYLAALLTKYLIALLRRELLSPLTPNTSRKSWTFNV